MAVMSRELRSAIVSDFDFGGGGIGALIIGTAAGVGGAVAVIPGGLGCLVDIMGAGIVMALGGVGYAGSVLDLSANIGLPLTEDDLEWSKLWFGVEVLGVEVAGVGMSCTTYSLGMHSEFGLELLWLSIPEGTPSGKNVNSEIGDVVLGPKWSSWSSRKRPPDG